MTTFLDQIARTLNFLPVFFLSFFLILSLSFFFFLSIMLESVQEERTTDSSVGWLNYNKSGRIYAAKCRCMEEKKEEEEKSF